AAALWLLVGIPIGILAATKPRSLRDRAATFFALGGLSMPTFVVGLLLLYSIPAAAVGFRSSALIMRLTRSSMLEVLRQDYIRTARAKGTPERGVNYDHALRNALLPVVTVIGIEAAFLIGGLIVTETVFNIPGVARFLVEAVRARDYPIVQNLVMFIAIVVVVVNFLVDMLYAALDPRIKYSD
ncbi:MAG TPA: ABC transporter permease, partial [Beijerinckiaceae bacterium]|nr:ABC transporter permease [Beijerinckiaceae bacterium]